MSKKKKDDLVIPKGTEITYAYVSFKFAITKDEAYQVLNNKRGTIARKMRKYMYDILKEACGRFFEEEKVETKDENTEHQPSLGEDNVEDTTQERVNE